MSKRFVDKVQRGLYEAQRPKFTLREFLLALILLWLAVSVCGLDRFLR